MGHLVDLPSAVAEAYLASARERGVPPGEWMTLFTAWSEGPNHSDLPDLPEEALDRESIYADRD